VAVTTVVGFHAFGLPRGGFLGVDLFFVLSGFLITTILVREHATTGVIRSADSCSGARCGYSRPS